MLPAVPACAAKLDWPCVDVGDGERAGGGEFAGDDADVLGHRAGGDAADHRHVVGAVDGDGDDLAAVPSRTRR